MTSEMERCVVLVDRWHVEMNAGAQRTQAAGTVGSDVGLCKE